MTLQLHPLSQNNVIFFFETQEMIFNVYILGLNKVDVTIYHSQLSEF